MMDIHLHQQLLDDVLHVRYWTSHKGTCDYWFLQRRDMTVRPAKHGPEIERQEDDLVTLHYVEPHNAEAHAVRLEVGRIYRNELACIFRVQNYRRAAEFLDKVDAEASAAKLCFGYHCTRESNLKWENILLNGKDPNRCKLGRFGHGAYFATTAEETVARYGKYEKTPVYNDARSRVPRIDHYKFCAMFLLNTGERYTFNEWRPIQQIPDGYGAFQDQGENEICLQDYQRLCPAYLLVFRETKDQYNSICKRAVEASTEDWDPSIVDTRTLMHRVCEHALGWRVAGPDVPPQKSAPFLRQRGGRWGYDDPLLDIM